MKTLAAAAFTFASVATAGAQHPLASARPWSVRVAESVMRRNPVASDKWDYTTGFVLLAIERVAEQRRDTGMLAYVRRSMEHFVQPDGSIRGYRAEERSLDRVMSGRLFFPLYRRTHDARWRRAAVRLRDQLATQPRTSEGGFWHKEIYPQQMWLDGLYMAEPFYAQYTREFAPGDTAAWRDIAKQFFLVARHTRDPKTGLLYHGWDASHAERWADSTTGQSASLWGRALGWYLMGLVDALDYLPANDADRPELIRLLREGADALVHVEDPVTGLWYQVLDQPNRAGNYREASASAMFAYVFAKGAREGYLPREYREIASRAFDGLLSNLVTVHPDGLVSIDGICGVAGLGGKPYRDGSFAYYVHEPIVSDDYKGVGAFILAAHELGR